jgi:hypothetical protein
MWGNLLFAWGGLSGKIETTMPNTQENDTAEAIRLVAEEIADQLQETDPPAREQLRRVIELMGIETAYDYLQKTLAAEAQGGILTHDGQRRRTPGGAFFFIARGQMPPHLRYRIWSRDRNRRPDNSANAPAPPEKRPGQPRAGRPSRPQKPGKPIQPILPWEERERLAAPALAEKGAATTVKITLVGRPGKVIERPDAVILTLTGPKPPALPKGLPVLPETAVTVFLVYVARKQWDKVAPSLQNPEDRVIIEGYPFMDAKLGVIGVLTQSATTVLLQRASRPTPPPTA